MKFTIEPDVINQESEYNLTRLWYNLEDLNEFFINSFEQMDAWERNSWKNNQSHEVKTVIEQSIVSWAQNNRTCKDCKKVSLLSTNDSYTIDEIINFVSQNFFIVVEDYDSDRKFFNCLVRLFKDESKKISQYKSKMKLEFFNGGGSTITKIIEGKVQELIERKLSPNKYNVTIQPQS